MKPNTALFVGAVLLILLMAIAGVLFMAVGAASALSSRRIKPDAATKPCYGPP